MNKKIIYIAGFPRSGSTILQNILNEIEGVASVGEIKTLIGYNIFKRKNCSCGQSIEECEFWSPVQNQIQQKYSKIELTDFEKLRKQLSNKNFYTYKYRTKKFQTEKFAKYSLFLNWLYNEIFTQHSIDCIVDSSKDPVYAWYLNIVLQYEVYFIHLYRDPEASYTSLQKDKAKSNYFRWTLMNRNSEYLQQIAPGRYFRLKYEDFTACPKEAIDELMKFAHIEGNNPIMKENKILFTGNHSLAGNPNRFKTGEIEIKKTVYAGDVLSTAQKKIISILNRSLLKEYGYK